MWIPRFIRTGATLNDIVIKGDNLTAGATDFIASSANFSVDTAGPEYQAAEVSANIVTITFDEDLNSASVPDASAFSVDVAGSRTVTNVAISGKNVELTIDGAAIIDSDTVTVSYTKPGSGTVLEDSAGNDADSLGSVIVGTSGANTLAGDANDNIITGNAGNDTLSGGGGNDIFDYNIDTDGDDRITDFTIGAGAEADKLDLSDLLTYTASDTLSDFLTVADDGSDVTIAIDANGDSSGTDLTITLIGIGTGSLDLAALTADDNLVVL